MGLPVELVGEAANYQELSIYPDNALIVTFIILYYTKIELLQKRAAQSHPLCRCVSVGFDMTLLLLLRRIARRAVFFAEIIYRIKLIEDRKHAVPQKFVGKKDRIL